MTILLTWALTIIVVSVTLAAGMRMFVAARNGAPREQLMGYVAIMLGASAVLAVTLRVV